MGYMNTEKVTSNSKESKLANGSGAISVLF